MYNSFLIHSSKQCCDEHWGTCVSFPSGFLSVYAQQWDCWIIRKFYFQFLFLKLTEVLVSQLCLTLCNSMDCSLPGSSVHGILQARILEWVAIPFSRGSSQPRDGPWVSYTVGRFFTIWATREATVHLKMVKMINFMFLPV